MNGSAALDFRPQRRYVVEKAAAGFPRLPPQINFALFAPQMVFTRNWGLTQKYFSGLHILIDVSPDNLRLACETVSSALQEVLDETALTYTSSTTAHISFYYREDSLEKSEFALAIFSLFY